MKGKYKMGINIKNESLDYVEKCVECPNGDFGNNMVFICCSDKLNYKKYPSGREVENYTEISDWCPYRPKKKRGSKK
jgi:hypothetical protein